MTVAPPDSVKPDSPRDLINALGAGLLAALVLTAVFVLVVPWVTATPIRLFATAGTFVVILVVTERTTRTALEGTHPPPPNGDGCGSRSAAFAGIVLLTVSFFVFFEFYRRFVPPRLETGIRLGLAAFTLGGGVFLFGVNPRMFPSPGQKLAFVLSLVGFSQALSGLFLSVIRGI